MYIYIYYKCDVVLWCLVIRFRKLRNSTFGKPSISSITGPLHHLMQRFFNKPRLMLWWKWKKTWNHPLVVCCRILGTHTVASRCTSVFFGITDAFWKGTDLIQEMDAMHPMRRCKSLHQSLVVSQVLSFLLFFFRKKRHVIFDSHAQSEQHPKSC